MVIRIKIFCNCGHVFEDWVMEEASIPVVSCPKCKKNYIGWQEVEPSHDHLFCNDEPTISDST